VHEYDDAGRLIRSVTYTEPEWDDRERGWALALLDLEADTCPGCGGSITETTRPESEGHWHVPPPTRCHRCTALANAQQPYAEAKHPQALLWSADRK